MAKKQLLCNSIPEAALLTFGGIIARGVLYAIGYYRCEHPLLKWSCRLELQLLMPVANTGAFGPSGQPSCFQRVKMGFLMGFCVGVASGAIFGGFSCLRYGLRGRELIQTVGKGMIQGGGTFGMFMAIGTAIRC